MMWKDKTYTSLTLLAYGLSVLPPLVCTLYYFPLWVSMSADCTISGIALILILLCAIPIFRAIKQHLKSPSAPIVWGLLAVSSYALGAIIDQVFVVALVGTISSTIAMMIFKYRAKHF